MNETSQHQHKKKKRKKKRNGTNERVAKSTAATATNDDQQPERAQCNLYHFIFTLNTRVLRGGLTRSFDFILSIWLKRSPLAISHGKVVGGRVEVIPLSKALAD